MTGEKRGNGDNKIIRLKARENIDRAQVANVGKFPISFVVARDWWK